MPANLRYGPQSDGIFDRNCWHCDPANSTRNQPRKSRGSAVKTAHRSSDRAATEHSHYPNIGGGRFPVPSSSAACIASMSLNHQRDHCLMSTAARDSSKNFTSELATRDDFSRHSHMTCVFQPRQCNSLRLRRSRFRLRSILASQYGRFDFGTRLPRGQEWPCQKQP